MHKYRLIGKKGEGTFSEVLKAQCIKNGKYVAIKCMKNHFDSLDQVNNLREIQALRRLSPHPGIIKLCEVLYDQPTRRLALVFELMDMNIYELIRGRRHYLPEERIKNYMYQLLKSMDHMHRNGIFHRDIKPENILITDDELKLADFGSCRGIYSKQPYTEYISTRWYRAPECLLTDGFYNYKMDMWGVGCVFFEVLSLYPLFPGTNELDQVTKIHQILGTPHPELLAKMKRRNQHIDFDFKEQPGSGIEKLIPHVTPQGVDLITKLLLYNPEDRVSARQALRHPYFRELRDTEKRAAGLMMTPEGHGASTSGHGGGRHERHHERYHHHALAPSHSESSVGINVVGGVHADHGGGGGGGGGGKYGKQSMRHHDRHHHHGGGGGGGAGGGGGMKLHEIGLPSISGSTHRAKAGGGLPNVGGGGRGGGELEKEPSFSEKDHPVPLGIRGGHIDVEALGAGEDQTLPPIGHRQYGFYGSKGAQKTLRNTLHGAHGGGDVMGGGGGRMPQAGNASTSSSSTSNKMKAFSRNLHMRFPSNVSTNHATSNSSKRNSKYVSPYSQRFIASQAQSNSNSGR